ncbi:MAG: hypothetical protein ACYDDF_02660 [Thermoplasmatota archaeon]
MTTIPATICPEGHGTWVGLRPRCPVCAAALHTTEVPAEGTLLARTTIANRTFAIVEVGDAATPAMLDGPAPEGAVVELRMATDGLLHGAASAAQSPKAPRGRRPHKAR